MRRLLSWNPYWSALNLRCVSEARAGTAASWPAEQLRAAPAAHGVLDAPGAESWWAREGVSKVRSEAEATSPSTPGAARRGRLSLPGRGRSERRRRQCSRQHRQESLPRFLPPALPEQADHTWETHGDDRATRGGPGPRPRSLGADGGLSAEPARVEKGNQCR